jgi:replicative DNA helicase
MGCLTPRRLTPPFPVDALPPWVADMVIAIAEFTQTPLDLPGCLALAALSTAAGGRAELEVRPGWREPLNLYTVVAMPPGSRKSAVFAAMTAPLLEAERQLVDQARPRIAEAEVRRKAAHAEAERRAKQASATRDRLTREEALASAADAAVEAEQIIVPPLPRLIADDVTTEAAASLLAEQGGRLAVLSAEGGIFSTLAGRYSGGVPSLEVFLKGHAGDLLRVDRKGRPAEHIAAPALTLGLALQPEVLTDIARMPGFRGRGLLARILYSLPENTVGRRRVGAAAVPAPVERSYSSRLTRLVVTFADHHEPLRLRLDEEADQRVLDLERALEPRLAPHAELAHVRDWASKLTGATARIAGLIHLSDLLSTAWTQPVGVRHVDAAARLGSILPSPRAGDVRSDGRGPRRRRRPSCPGLGAANRSGAVHTAGGVLGVVPAAVPQGHRPRPGLADLA